MENDITKLVQKAMQLLREFNLKESSLKSYNKMAFHPIIDYYQTHYIKEFQEPLMDKLEIIYQGQFKNELISKQSLNCRIRGIKIISEIHSTGSYR